MEKTNIIQRIKETKISPQEEAEFFRALENWYSFIGWLKNQRDPEKIFKCLTIEILNKRRSHYLDRLRTRYNKQRALYELRELEKYAGQVISINLIGKRKK